MFTFIPIMIVAKSLLVFAIIVSVLCLLFYVVLLGYLGWGIRYDIEKIYWRFNKSKLTLKIVNKQLDANTKWNLIELYGIEKYIKDYQVGYHSKDNYGILYRIIIHSDLPAFVVVKVRNNTKESDGSHKRYYIRVHPSCISAQQAVAWSFSLMSSDYTPLIET
jgi:hypothetical protein